MTYTMRQRTNSYFLFTTLIAGILVSIPLISNHFLHPSHFFHIAIHEAGFLLAIFLVGITIISYRETKLPRMLFAAAAFGTLAITQLGYLYEKIDTPAMVQVTNGIAEEHFDVGILIMTAIFAAGIFYKRF